jgi:hypothetical protein
MSYENLIGSGLQKVGGVGFQILFEAAKNWHFPLKVWTKSEYGTRLGRKKQD